MCGFRGIELDSDRHGDTRCGDLEGQEREVVDRWL